MTELWCIFVKKRDGERLRRWLIQNSLLVTNVKIQSEDDWIIFPIERELIEKERKELEKTFKNLRVEYQDRDWAITQKRKDLFSELKSSIPEKLHKYIPKSFDTIGQLVILEIPEEIGDFGNLIGQTILDINPSISSVFKKLEPISGEFRLRNVELLAGVNKSETIYKENKCVFELDIKKVYFSPRLVTEHERVCSLVKRGESILDLFAGIGPFSILIAKTKKTPVVAVDINPDAIYYLKKNILLNKVEKFVYPVEGDAREVIKTIPEQKFDRIIMNLPSKASEFLDIALDALTEGGIIHFYEFTSESDYPEKAIGDLKNQLKKYNRTVKEIVNIRKVRAYAPYMWHIGIDFSVQ
jgi:tRNA (guanine37-N1)-methyltransferase